MKFLYYLFKKGNKSTYVIRNDLPLFDFVIETFSITETNMEQTQVDRRMEFLGNCTLKTLKLKTEKWSRLVNTEEHKTVIIRFLERPHPTVLVIILTASAQLQASNTFPVTLKSKGNVFETPIFFVPILKTLQSSSEVWLRQPFTMWWFIKTNSSETTSLRFYYLYFVTTLLQFQLIESLSNVCEGMLVNNMVKTQQCFFFITVRFL